MRVNWLLLAGCALTGAIALAVGCAWMAVTGQDTIPIPVGILAAVVSVALALAVERTVLEVRRRRGRVGPARHRRAAG